MSVSLNSSRRLISSCCLLLCSFWICLAGCTQNEVPGQQEAATESTGSPSGTAEIQDEETWQVIYVNDQRIGYAFSETSVDDSGESKLVHHRSDSYLKLKRFGQSLQMETHLSTTENSAGELQSYTFEMKNPPADSTVTEGKITKDKLEVETRIANQVQRTQVNWQPTYHSPSYLERMFETSPMKPGETRSFSMLLPEYSKVSKVNLQAVDYETVELFGGEQAKCLHIKMKQELLPGMEVDLYVTESGEIPKTVADFLGSSMMTYVVSKEVALEALTGGELDLAVQTLIRVKPIPGAHDRNKAVYLVTLKEGNPAEILPTGPTQEVKPRDDQSVELTVRKAKIPTQFPQAEVADEYTGPTPFIQSDDARVKQYVADAVKSEENPWKQATLMERYVQQNLKKKNFSTALASAAEVARNMEGDCTEHAVLLAAMLRAQGLPSRVAVGLVYIPTRSSFGGHMWTEVFLDGRWIPLDATLGKGGIGAGHIKLADSSLSENAPAPLAIFLPILRAIGKLSIEVLEPGPARSN